MQSPRVGERFGRYFLQAQIGVGGMGEVYAATDTHLNRTVALKVVSAQFAESPEFRHRFQREAETLARLDSPHIVAIFDHGEVEGVPYLATQYVRGGDLGLFLRDHGALGAEQVLTVCSQLAEALHDAHEAGIIHRDIKPSNVLLRDPAADRLYSYLCDFGIAQDQGSAGLTSAGAVVGTWAYLAPERGQGVPATRASDIYSLGCLLWVCLTGEPPYTGTDVSIAMAHQSAPVRQLLGDDPHVRHLNSILARSMAKDPAARFATARELRRALEKTPPKPPPAPPTVAAHGPPSAPYPQPGRGGRRAALVLAAVLAVLLVGGGVVWAVSPWGDVPVDRVSRGSTGSTDSPEPDPEPDPDEAVRGDLDDDGYGDAVALFQDGTDGQTFELTYDSEGDRFTTSRRRLPTFPDPVFADLDGDQQPDRVELLVDPEQQTLELTSEDSDIDGQVYDEFQLADETVAFVTTLAGDFTGDGDVDLAAWGQSGNRTVTVWVLENDGSGQLAAPEEWVSLDNAHVYTTSLYAGDFDDDGASDLLARLPMGDPDFDSTGATYTGPEGTQLLASTGEDFDTGARLAELDGLDTSAVYVGDFSGDGTPLVLLFSASTATTTTTPSEATVYSVLESGLLRFPRLGLELPDNGFESTPRGVASDVDGDGIDDLVFTRKSDDTTYEPLKVARSDGSQFEDPLVWAEGRECTDELCFLYFPPTY